MAPLLVADVQTPEVPVGQSAQMAMPLGEPPLATPLTAVIWPDAPLTVLEMAFVPLPAWLLETLRTVPPEAALLVSARFSRLPVVSDDEERVIAVEVVFVLQFHVCA